MSAVAGRPRTPPAALVLEDIELLPGSQQDTGAAQPSSGSVAGGSAMCALQAENRATLRDRLHGVQGYNAKQALAEEAEERLTSLREVRRAMQNSCINLKSLLVSSSLHMIILRALCETWISI